jgi:hypothetical protein
MRRMRGLTILSIMLILCIHLRSFAQPNSNGDLTQKREVRLLAKNSQTGKKEIVNLYNQVHGVIIGIDLYVNLPPGQQLRYAVKDAKGIENMLIERFIFDEIFTLYNREATKEAIVSKLLGKLSQTAFDDAVFVFFAGHGFTDTTKYGELGYIVPYDGSFDKDKLYKNISMTQLKEDVSRQIPAKHVFFMVDACYSGLLVTRGKETQVNESFRDLDYLRKITREPVRQVLTAGGKDEKVLDGGPYGHSVFVGRILQLLENTSDYITASELSIKVKERVFSDARGMGHIQTPAFGVFFGLGDFVFIPREDKRYEEVRDEILKLQSQLKEIERQKKEAEQIKAEKEIREAKRKAAELKARLKAEQMEQERLRKERERRDQLKKEIDRLSQEEAKRKLDREKQIAAEEERLKQLREKLSEERAKLKDLKNAALSVDAAREEVGFLQSKIKNVVTLVSPQIERVVNQLREDYRPLRERLKKLAPVKGQFETTESYLKRLEKHNEKVRALEEIYKDDYQEIQKRYDDEIAVRTKIYREQIQGLKNRKYPVEGLEVDLLEYDADKKFYLVRLKDSRGNNWHFSLSIKPEIARRLYEGRHLIKVRVFYSSLFNTDSLSEASIIEPISGKLMQILVTRLRSDFAVINKDDARHMMKRFGFFDKERNNAGNFRNHFIMIKVKDDKVVVDFSTGLMWHQSGSSDYMTLETAKFWISNLNCNGYAGYHDWRIPTLEEAASLLESKKNNADLYIDPVFSNQQPFIWTGDKESENGFWVWVVYFSLGFMKYDFNNDFYSVRPVRSLK